MAITLHTDIPESQLPEQTELVEGRHRDEFQRQIDADVLKLKIDTARAGWPDPDPTKLYHRYVVGADDVAALNQVIRRAGTLHKLEIEFYKKAKTEAGHWAVKFHVSRKLDKENKPVDDDTLDKDGKWKADTEKPAAPAAPVSPAAAKPSPVGGVKK